MGSNISVIIPCYNGWRYMSKCLESLELQSLSPYEVVVVDDCSTDDSYVKLSEYACTATFNMIVLKNKTNVGPGLSRKNAIDACHGSYVAFCDCDDWFELDFIETLTNQIQANEADAFMFDNYKTYDGYRIVANTVKVLQNDKKSILANAGMSLCRFVVKREIAEKVFFPPLYHGEDGAVVPQIIAKSSKFILIDRPFYNYYSRSDSISQRPSAKACSQMALAFSVVRNELPQEYRLECEYIGIKCVCYGAVLSGFKSGVKSSEIEAVLDDFEKGFPAWERNVYRKNLGKIKNLYLFFVKKRWFGMVRLMTFLHGYYIKLRKGK